MTTATMTQKRFAADMTVAKGERSFIAKITSDALDRDNEVLLPQGMDASEFELNPVVFFNHEHSDMPVGHVTSLKRETDHWLAKVLLVSRPKDHTGEWVPDTLLHLIQQGVVRGMSVGVMPVETRRPSGKDKEMFGNTIKMVISKWKLIELSIAPIPANQEALITAVSKKVKKGNAPKRVILCIPRTPLRKSPPVVRPADLDTAVRAAVADAMKRYEAKVAGKMWVD